jgi:hypothetical protein
MNTRISKNSYCGADRDGAPQFTLGRPTLAGSIPAGFEKLFEPVGNPTPEFAKLPRPRERCPITGASRTWLLEHGDAGHFKLVRIRKTGATRGAIFVHVASLLAFLHSHMEGQVSASRPEVNSCEQQSAQRIEGATDASC